mmetsp:Transcript_2323/g.4396  ORF Transcript_2323/g.4396 Transcript_2323/m.4396 type:complete len:97 (+) Transcript_2323:259-549(+)
MCNLDHFIGLIITLAAKVAFAACCGTEILHACVCNLLVFCKQQRPPLACGLAAKTDFGHSAVLHENWVLLQCDNSDGRQHNFESACCAKLSMPTQT